MRRLRLRLRCLSGAGQQRRLREVPRPLLLLFAGALAAQLLLASATPRREAPLQDSASAATAAAAEMPQAFIEPVARAMALGDPATFSRALSLWLQNADYEPGLSLPLASLDYPRVGAWLDLQLALDAENRFPMLAALHLYGSVGERDKVRWMLEWVARHFREAPAARWRYMAEAAVKAKHKLGDLQLAYRLASELDQRTRGLPLPGWARQLHIFLKADLGEREEARALLGALIESGQITRPEELRFLSHKLAEMTAQKGDENPDEVLTNRRQSVDISPSMP